MQWNRAAQVFNLRRKLHRIGEVEQIYDSSSVRDCMLCLSHMSNLDLQLSFIKRYLLDGPRRLPW